MSDLVSSGMRKRYEAKCRDKMLGISPQSFARVPARNEITTITIWMIRRLQKSIISCCAAKNVVAAPITSCPCPTDTDSTILYHVFATLRDTARIFFHLELVRNRYVFLVLDQSHPGTRSPPLRIKSKLDTFSVLVFLG